MNAHRIRGWLLKQPRPVQIRLTCADVVSIMELGGESWASVAASIAAMDPDLVEALNDKGKLIRATKPIEDDDEAAPAAAAAALPVSSMVDVATLQLVSKLLAEAYKHSTETAFARLADLFVASNKRSENLEKSLATYERLLRKQFEDQINNAPEQSEGGFVAEIAKQFIGGQQTAAAAAANGKGHS